MPIHRPRVPGGPPGFSSRPRDELRALAFRPAQRFRGTPYPCTESGLYDAVTPYLRPRRERDYVSANHASREIVVHNALGRDLSRGEYDAIRRLETMIRGVFIESKDWAPDLIIKAFIDLDRVFFLGRLRGHVHVQWKSASSFPEPTPRRLTMGVTTPLGGGKARIRLNADAIFASTRMSTFKEMWRTMLHEMCHAYEITQVAEQNWQSDKHGAHFGTKVMAVHERARREIHVGAVHRLESYSVYDFVQPRRTR